MPQARPPEVFLFLVTALAVVLSPFVYSQAASPEQASPAEKKGTAIIRGTVVAADTGAPLSGIVVRPVADIDEVARTGRVTLSGAVSADNGSFELKQLAAGKYDLYASAGQDRPLYLSWWYGATKYDGRGTRIDVADAALIEKLVIRLPRAAAISGRVLNEKGDPLAWVAVNAWPVGGSGATSPRWSARDTDDYGRFRIFGLAPGQYVVKAETQAREWAASSDDHSVTGYVPTFYPAALSADLAQMFTVEAGEEIGDIDVVLRRTRTFRVSGTLVSQASRERRGQLAYSTDGRNWSTAASARTGAFSVFGLTPGEYTFVGSTFDPTDPGVEPEASSPVTVTVDQDVDGVVLPMRYGARVNGHVSFDIGDVKLPIELRVRSMAPALARAPVTIAPSAVVKDDGTFSLTRVFGPSIIGVVGAPAGVRQAVIYKGNDITDVATEFADAASPKDLEILLTTKGAEVNGRVVNAKGSPLKDVDVYLFPADKRRWIMSGLAWRQATTGRDGRFGFKPLAPGDYFALALDEPIWPLTRRMKDPEVFATLASIATPVQLVSSEVRGLPLTVARLPR